MINKRRLELIDSIRGITIISMILFHACWIMNYFGLYITDQMLFGRNFYIWERTICCSFIFISGYVYSLGSKQMKKGLSLLLIGIVITIGSLLIVYDIRDIFGILWLLGLAPLIMTPIDSLLKERVNNKYLSVICALLMLLLLLLTWKINSGYIGWAGLHKYYLTKKLYKGYFMTLLGFKDPNFYSVDYFSILPWIFLYALGYFVHKILKNSKFEETILTIKIPILNYIGKYSLQIYLIHPVVLYIVILCIDRIAK